jgi:hypothetical protein
MRDPLENDLLDEFRNGRVLLVVGSGVSRAATRGDPVATWPGLLRSGVKHLRKLREVSQDWADGWSKEIDRGDAAKLVEVAEEIKKELPEAELGRWLEDSVGSLQAKDRSVILALRRLDVPIATTNYDNLIEDVTRLRAVTWQDPSLFVRLKGKVVLHLHGHRDWPDSIVLGTGDYVKLASNQVAQEMQRALSVTNSLLWVGFGAGLDDPNFDALRTWMRDVWGGASLRHYRLCLKEEEAELVAKHKGEQIYPVVYGTRHEQLAPYLRGLGDRLGRPGGKLRYLVRLAVAAVAAWPGRVRGWRRSMPLGALLGVVAAAAVMVAGLVTWVVRPGPGAAACPIPRELVVLTTPTKEASIRRLAVAFSDQEQGSCRRSSVTVFSVPSSSTVADALAGRWSRDDLSLLGPEPAVWMPDATAEVELVNQRLGDDLESLGSIATSPVVLAVPESAMARVGEERTVQWRTMVEWARRSAPGSRLRIGRPDPSSSTAGLLATIGLNRWSGGATTPDSRHAVEQSIDPVADELTELCQLGEPGGPARAVLVSEQAMVAYNRDRRLGGSCDAREESPERLTAVYAADGTPILDHPFVLLPAATAPKDRAELAHRFFDYLSGPAAQGELRDAGFRDAARNVGGSLGAVDGVLVHDPPTWADPPDGPTLAREVIAWDKARLPARALLAMDVSGSMSEELPGPGGRRITAAREAAKRAVGLMGGKDQIGLWRFSQSLDGPRDYQELVPLGPAGRRDGGGRGSDQVVETLDGLRATNEDTGLYDTIHAGIGELRAGGGPDAVDALIVVTDGQNDDRNGGVGLGEVVNRLQEEEDVLVFLLTFGPARCNGGELERLTTGQPDRVRCLDGDRVGLARAFEQVAATLWGTGRPAAGGAG